MIDVRELEQLIDKLSDKKLLSRAVSNSLYNASEYVRKESIKPYSHKWQKRTGTVGTATKLNVNGLSSSIFVDLSRAPHALFLYEGTKDHEIRPKSKNALSFVVGSERYFSKGHTVKGIKAEPWILNTYNKRKSMFNKIFKSDLIEELQGAL